MNTSGSKMVSGIRKTVARLLILLAIASAMPGQTQDLVIGTAVICPGQEVLLPVTAYNINNAGAITLFIGFDTLRLDYLSVENIDPQLNGMSYNFMTNPPQLAVAWSSLTGASFPNTKFFDLRLWYHGGDAPVVFGSGCEITDVNLSIIPVTYFNGSVEPANPVITLQPKDTTVTEGGTATFSVVTQSVAQPRWKESADNGATWTDLQDGGPYSGTQTLNLTISGIPAGFDTYRYKCVLVYASCSTESDHATLHVDTLSALNPSGNQIAGWIRIIPNPFENKTRVNYNVMQPGHVRIAIYYLYGGIHSVIENREVTQGEHFVEFDAGRLAPGTYLCNLLFDNEDTSLSLWTKLIKTE